MKKLRYIFFSLFFISCFAHMPRYLKKNFTYCYEKKCTNIDTLIHIAGYFRESILGENDLIGKVYDVSKPDTMGFMNFILYKNGMCVFGFHNYEDSLSVLFKELQKNKNDYFYKGGPVYWGCYQIYRDTIKLQVTNHPSFMAPWMVYEEWYKIIDRNTLQPIAYKRLDIDFDDKNKTIQQMIILNPQKHLPATFFPVKEKPESKYSWILKRKWFWCDKKQFKEWKKKKQ